MRLAIEELRRDNRERTGGEDGLILQVRHSSALQAQILRCRNAFEAVAVEVARVASLCVHGVIASPVR